PGESLSEYAPDGPYTDIPSAVERVLTLARSGTRRPNGMILLSDGRQLDSAAGYPEAALRARAQGVPIYAAVLGGDVQRRDLSVEMSRRQYVAFVNQEVRLTAKLKARGLGRLRPKVRLKDASGNVLEEKDVLLEDGGEASVRFAITPREAGHARYSVEVPPWPGEDRRANNTARAGLSALDSRIRVLVAEGVPFWDSKFMVQLLRREPNVEVTSVYRLSSERFFRIETRLDQAAEISEAVFPDTAEVLNRYDVIVFGKGAEYFLDPPRIRLLREFVRDRGGCVLFARGKPYSGRFPEMEILEPVTWGAAFGRPFSLRPTGEGQALGLFGDRLPAPDDVAWAQLPPLHFANRVSTIKSFSHVLMKGHAPSGQHEFPVLIGRRFGKGVLVTVNAEGLWKWDFFPENSDAGSMYEEFWTQLVQWAVTFADFLPGTEYAVALSAHTVYPGEAVRVRITHRFPSESCPAPEIRVTRDGRLVRTVRPSAAGNDPGRWETVFAMDAPGMYYLTVQGEKEHAGRVRTVLEVSAPLREQDLRSADPDFLRDLARTSGGGLIERAQLAERVRSFSHEARSVDKNRAAWQPAWDRWWLLCLTIACFGAEWFLRRRNGLL
ncbi:MAG: hypothetical protein K9N49_10540, partial [Candidatus Marinimicrobia bacterium]|nr:hypothetical protein [Candidatus Neomarinimicrobiota bacterium]